MAAPATFDADAVLRSFLDEDGVCNDLTSRSLVPPSTAARARLIARTGGTVAGLAVAERVFQLVDPGLRFETPVSDGARVEPGSRLARVSGPARAVLAAERTALNLLQRMSGIATATARYVEAVAGTGASILDTRKTAPGLRHWDRQAVRAGGGVNHRSGLHDEVLIKENHLAWMDPSLGERPLEAAIEAARREGPSGTRITIEVRDPAEALRAARVGPDVVLLDNFPVDRVAEAVALCRECPGVATEASGGITLDNVRAYAETGVHRLSIGSLTHSFQAMDISLLFETG